MGEKHKGQFGSAVIGEKAASEEREFIKSGQNTFGPAVLDSDHTSQKLDIGSKSGRRLDRPGRKGNTAVPKAVKPKPINTADFMVGIRGLREHLLGKGDDPGNPMLVDEFMQAELVRPEGIRKTAISTLVEAEKKRPGGPRDEVLETLADWD